MRFFDVLKFLFIFLHLLFLEEKVEAYSPNTNNAEYCWIKYVEKMFSEPHNSMKQMLFAFYGTVSQCEEKCLKTNSCSYVQINKSVNRNSVQKCILNQKYFFKLEATPRFDILAKYKCTSDRASPPSPQDSSIYCWRKSLQVRYKTSGRNQIFFEFQGTLEQCKKKCLETNKCQIVQLKEVANPQTIQRCLLNRDSVKREELIVDQQSVDMMIYSAFKCVDDIPYYPSEPSTHRPIITKSDYCWLKYTQRMFEDRGETQFDPNPPHNQIKKFFVFFGSLDQCKAKCLKSKRCEMVQIRRERRPGEIQKCLLSRFSINLEKAIMDQRADEFEIYTNYKCEKNKPTIPYYPPPVDESAFCWTEHRNIKFENLGETRKSPRDPYLPLPIFFEFEGTLAQCKSKCLKTEECQMVQVMTSTDPNSLQKCLLNQHLINWARALQGQKAMGTKILTNRKCTFYELSTKTQSSTSTYNPHIEKKKSGYCWMKYTNTNFENIHETGRNPKYPYEQIKVFFEFYGTLEQCQKKCLQTELCQVVQIQSDPFTYQKCFLNRINVNWGRVTQGQRAKGITVYANYKCSTNRETTTKQPTSTYKPYYNKNYCWHKSPNTRFDNLGRIGSNNQVLFFEFKGNLSQCKKKCLETEGCQVIQVQSCDKTCSMQTCLLNKVFLDPGGYYRDERSRGYEIYTKYWCPSNQNTPYQIPTTTSSFGRQDFCWIKYSNMMFENREETRASSTSPYQQVRIFFEFQGTVDQCKRKCLQTQGCQMVQIRSTGNPNQVHICLLNQNFVNWARVVQGERARGWEIYLENYCKAQLTTRPHPKTQSPMIQERVGLCWTKFKNMKFEDRGETKVDPFNPSQSIRIYFEFEGTLDQCKKKCAQVALCQIVQIRNSNNPYSVQRCLLNQVYVNWSQVIRGGRGSGFDVYTNHNC